MDVVEKLVKNHSLEEEEYKELLFLQENKEVREFLRKEAIWLRKKYYGNKVFIRGLIEFTNYCKNGCYYCGINRKNKNVRRYRLTKEEILDCCRQGYELGFRTFVLQGGEDPFFTDDLMVTIIETIKEEYRDCALTLSVGEKTLSSYSKYKAAGADRFLLRHETSNPDHYARLHPKDMSWQRRMQCLMDLKSLSFQVGAGFMVGSPGQRRDDLAKELSFLQRFRPQMVGIGPFIPHHETIFSKESAGSVEETLFLLSVIRIILPEVLLPATTALGTLRSDGREAGLLCGANVVMPNLSPRLHREDYSLYDNKISTGEEAAESVALLSQKIKKIGYQIVSDRGDSLLLD